MVLFAFYGGRTINTLKKRGKRNNGCAPKRNCKMSNGIKETKSNINARECI